jgi:hypothetical protein
MIIKLQQSLELEGISYQPEEEVDVPEWLYDQLVDTYLALNSKPDAMKDFYTLSLINTLE